MILVTPLGNKVFTHFGLSPNLLQSFTCKVVGPVIVVLILSSFSFRIVHKQTYTLVQTPDQYFTIIFSPKLP